MECRRSFECESRRKIERDKCKAPHNCDRFQFIRTIAAKNLKRVALSHFSPRAFCRLSSHITIACLHLMKTYVRSLLSLLSRHDSLFSRSRCTAVGENIRLSQSVFIGIKYVSLVQQHRRVFLRLSIKIFKRNFWKIKNYFKRIIESNSVEVIKFW